MTLKHGMQHRVLENYKICSNDDPVLTLTYFTTRSNLVPCAFEWEKGKTMDFSETIVVYDIKVGRCSEQKEYTKLYEYQRSRSFIDLRPRSLRFKHFQTFFIRNFFSLEAKLIVEPPLDGGMKVSRNGLSHMTKMAAMSIYGKNF